MGIEAVRQGDRELDFHPAFGERWEITQSTVEVFEGIVWLDPRMPGPPPHVHPNSEETFEVLEGSLEVFRDGAWTTMRSGESASVPAGAPHTFRNHSDEPVKFSGRLQPAARAEEFFGHMVTLIREGKIKGPRDLRSGIYVAMLFTSYPDVSRIVGPLNGVMKVMALLGKAFRLKL